MNKLFRKIMSNKLLVIVTLLLLIGCIITIVITVIKNRSETAGPVERVDNSGQLSYVAIDDTNTAKDATDTAAGTTTDTTTGTTTDNSDTIKDTTVTTTDNLEVPTAVPALTSAAAPDGASETTPTIITIPDIDLSSSDYDLYSLDFVDMLNGWVVLWKYNSLGADTSTSLLHSKDGGISWEAYNSNGCLLQQVSFADNKHGWALAIEGTPQLSTGDIVTYQVLHTEDGGESWTLQMSEESVYGDGCDIMAYGESSACALISGGVYHTEDGGRNWVDSKIPVKGFYAENIYITGRGHGWVSGVVKSDLTSGQKSAKPDAVYEQYDYSIYVFSTEDGAQSWRQQLYLNYGNEWTKTLGISFADEMNGWLLTCDYGTFDGDLYHTADGGGNWEKVNKLRVCRPYAMGIEAVTPDCLWIPFHHGAGPIDGGLYHSEDRGISFEVIGSDTETFNSNGVDFVTPSMGWAVLNGYPDKYLIKTEDGGKTWEKIGFR